MKNRYPNLSFAMEKMGESYRMDWSFVDGRTIRDEMNYLVDFLDNDVDMTEEELDDWLEGHNFVYTRTGWEWAGW